jgi:hypothetical protein
MNRKPIQTDESWENDAVWKLLDQVPPITASPRFVENAVRAAKLTSPAEPWWKKLLSPMPLAGFAGATAALVFSVFSVFGPETVPVGNTIASDSLRKAEIQDIAETETLIAAADHLDEFSDNELVTLIGF